MNAKILRQCKKVILTNNKTDRDIKLSLSDKCYLRKLSKNIKSNGNIDDITFEEFVLLCKHHKIKATLKIEDGCATRFYDLLNFDNNTLRSIMEKCTNDILANKEQSNIQLIYNYYTKNNNVILFEDFMNFCNRSKIKVNIE